MKQQKQNKQVVDDFKQEKKKKQRVHFLKEMVGNLKNISFSLYYNHIIDDSLTLWSYKWVICFLYFRIPYFCRNPLLFI